MTDDNLPPGLSIRDIPGNRPLDDFQTRVMEAVSEEYGNQADASAATEGWPWLSITESYRLGYSVQHAATLIEEEIKRRRPKIDEEGL